MRSSERGQSGIELLIAVVIVALAAAIAIPVYRAVIAREDRAAVSRAAHELHRALLRYEHDHGSFPAPPGSGSAGLDRATLEPLAGDYLHDLARLVEPLAERGLLTYDAGGEGHEPRFWATVASARQPGYVLLVAHTDELPLDRGDTYDGVYVVRPDGLERMSSQR